MVVIAEPPSAPTPTSFVSVAAGLPNLGTYRYSWFIRVSGSGARGLLFEPSRAASHSNRARLVRRLPRVGVEDGVGQLIRGLVVHRDEDLAGLNRVGDEGPRADLAAR